jgi:hypothetical protein
MGTLRKRLDRIEERIEREAENILLVKFPEKPGFTYQGRTFPSVEVAVEILEKERGCKINHQVVEVVFVSPDKTEPKALQDRIDCNGECEDKVKEN